MKWTGCVPGRGVLASRLPVPLIVLVCGAGFAHVQGVLPTPGSGGPGLGRAGTGRLVEVHAVVETLPVPVRGDAADDVAIWVDPEDPSRSTIIGTNKQAGIAVYDLAGRMLQYLRDGRLNNVDLRPGFELGGSKAVLVTAGNRSDNSIAIYRINPRTRLLEDVAARKVKTTAVYGSCMYHSPHTGTFYYIVTSKSGRVEQWELTENGRGKVDVPRKVRSFDVGGQVEGCVTDDELGWLYVGEEDVGIWKYGAEPGAGDRRTQVDSTGRGGHLVADVEGLALARQPGGRGFLVASSQGNSSFVVYRREGTNPFVKIFRVVDGDRVDGVEETDGIDITTANLGPPFPHGVFVAQDGSNDDGNQNFKLVPLELILGPVDQW